MGMFNKIFGEDEPIDKNPKFWRRCIEGIRLKDKKIIYWVQLFQFIFNTHSFLILILSSFFKKN
jgi:hypothetical protein